MRKALGETWFAGVDGCRAGWVVAFVRPQSGEVRLRVVPCFAEVITAPETPAIIAVDIPIGLPERAGRAGGLRTTRSARFSARADRRCFRFLHVAQSLQKLARSTVSNRDGQPISVHARSPGRLQFRRGASPFLISPFFPRFARWTRSSRATARSMAGCAKRILSLHFGASMERARWHQRRRPKWVLRCVGGC